MNIGIGGMSGHYTPSKTPISNSKHVENQNYYSTGNVSGNGSGNNNDNGNDNDNSIMLLPPSQTIAESLSALAHSTSQQLETVWDKIGLSPEERADQLTDLLSTFREACENKVAAEQEVMDNYRQMIAEYKQEIRDTSKALKLSVDEKLVREHSPDETDNNGHAVTSSSASASASASASCLTMQDEVYTLELALEDLRNEAEISRNELTKCSNLILENCQALGQPSDPEWSDVESDLTSPRVRMFQEKVKEMQDIVATRTNAVVQLIRDSQELIDAMRIDPNDHLLDRKIMVSLIKDEEGNVTIVSKFETDDCTGISAKTLQALTERVSELHSEKRRRKAKLTEMGSVIAELWEKLHIPKEQQSEFAESINGLGLDTLSKGEQEIERLFTLKEEMMGGLIVETRNRIESLWDETNATPEQRATFQAINIVDETLFNDELLEQHENYIKVLEQRLEQMRPIIDVIVKREAIVQERMLYEEFLKDPTRLQQRGAALTRQLMKEEKMSRRIKKDLPKYTDHLTKKLKEWAHAHDEPFMYKGEDYLSMIKRQEDLWQVYKENQAQLKRQKKQDERTSYTSKSSGGFQRRTVGSTVSHSSSIASAPLEDKTNTRNGPDDNKPRSKSRFRALSRGRNKKDEENNRAKSRPRGLMNRGKSKEPGARGLSRSRGVFSRGRAQPTGR